jgi:hypothetical protein
MPKKGGRGKGRKSANKNGCLWEETAEYSWLGCEYFTDSEWSVPVQLRFRLRL